MLEYCFYLLVVYQSNDCPTSNFEQSYLSSQIKGITPATKENKN